MMARLPHLRLVVPAYSSTISHSVCMIGLWPDYTSPYIEKDSSVRYVVRAPPKRLDRL